MFRRKPVLVLLAALAAAATAAGIAVAAKGNGNNKTFEYTIGLWGDTPYSVRRSRVQRAPALGHKRRPLGEGARRSPEP